MIEYSWKVGAGGDPTIDAQQQVLPCLTFVQIRDSEVEFFVWFRVQPHRSGFHFPSSSLSLSSFEHCAPSRRAYTEMSRPVSKRRRIYALSPPDDDDEDPFTTSSAAHIFAAASGSRLTSDVLHPTSYEVTLNHDAELKRSFELKDDPEDLAVSRLVKWTSRCGKHTVTTDRYDAIHLLSELPNKPPLHTSSEATDDMGWSDLDSDTEDLFFMTDAEAAQFVHNKARTALDAQRAARLAELGSAPPSPASPPPTAGIEPRVEEPLSRNQFELMQKTARVVTSSNNASLLEIKILANHGGDERFAFLRKDHNQTWGGVWDRLKATEGAMSYDDARRLLEDEATQGCGSSKAGKKREMLGLVAYDDSDSEVATLHDDEVQKETYVDTAIAEEQGQDMAEEAAAAALKKQKQAERLARAKVWLQNRSAKPSSPPHPPPPPPQPTSS